jgi:N-acetylmuramoyl-L-alanine amidase
VELTMPYDSIAISSGHGKHIRGASCPPPGLDEVDEARKTVDRLASELIARGVDVKTFHDDVSDDQDENLKRICDWHNEQLRELDISCHFNAYNKTDKPMGTEVLYVSQGKLASDLSEAIASAGGFLNRGAKENTGLYFLNHTDMPAVLLEICFVDSYADADLYRKHFEAICSEMADVLGGVQTEMPIKPERPPLGSLRPPRQEIKPPNEVGGVPIEPPASVPRIDIKITGDVILTINGEEMGA